jgi:hypothetical protein
MATLKTLIQPMHLEFKKMIKVNLFLQRTPLTVSAKHTLKVTLYARAASSSKLPKIGVRVTTKIIGRAIIRQMFVPPLPALHFKE